MVLKETLDQLAVDGYLVYVNNSPVFTSKLYQELGVTDLQSPVLEPLNKPRKRVRGSAEAREIWHKFVKDAELPWRVTSTTGSSYTVCQFSVAAVDKLISILEDPNVDPVLFTQSVKHYYATVTYKTTFQKYLMNEIWKFEYDQFKNSKKAGTINRSHGFED